MKKEELFEKLKSDPLFSIGRYSLYCMSNSLEIESKDGFFGSVLFETLNLHSLDYCLDCKTCTLTIFFF